MIPYVDIYIYNPVNFYNEYELTKDELSWLIEMFEEDKGQEATDVFIQQFILPPSTKYQDVITSYLGFIDSGILKKDKINSLTRNVTALTLGLISIIQNNYSKYVKGIYAPFIFKENKITIPGLKNSIIDEVISKFMESFEAALLQTGVFTVNSIRTIQRELIAANYQLKKMGLSSDAVDMAIKTFKDALRKKYPSIYKAIENKNIVTTAKITEEGTKFLRYKIDYYVDMSVRATLLNVDRTSVQIAALANDEFVVEYYLSDDRVVKKDREICQEILAKQIYGKSILALNDNVAQKLGIMSVDEARFTPDYAMGPNCRHNIRRLSRGYLNQINKLLEEAA